MAIIETLLEHVGESEDLDVFVDDGGALLDVFGVVARLRVDDFSAGADGVEQCAGAATATTDEANFHGEIFAAGGVDVGGSQCGDCGGTGDGGCLNEVAAGNNWSD